MGLFEKLRAFGMTPFTWNYLAGSDLKSSLAYPNGLTASWTYGNRGELLEVNNASPTGTISRYVYTYDAAGRRISCAHSGSAFDTPDSYAYFYNARSELTNATATVDAAYRYGYDFDDIGNRNTSSELGTNVTYAVNNLNQYMSVDEFVPRYDDDGNQTLVKTATGTWHVAYNGENRPILWTLGTNTISMSFDRMGRRVTKNDQRFVYNGYLQIANHHSSTSTSHFNYYIWDPTEPVATRPLVWNFSTVQPFNSSTFFYTHDGNKNVSEVIASDGTLAAHYEYAPFGALTVQRGASAVINPWRFSSEYAEDDTAMVYYNYRHYEPWTGRWLSRDPIEERGGVNLLAFVKNGSLFKLDIRGTYLTVDECQKIVDRLWGGWDDVGPSIDGEILTMQILLQTNDCGCKRPRCFCTIEHKTGLYDSNNNLVEINAYKSTKDSVRNTVLHEMQHAYDQCIIGDIADCADRAKREVRAVIRSGRCGLGSKIDWACVKDTAKRSVR